MKRSKITNYVASNTVKVNILTLIWSKQRLQAHEEWKRRTSTRVSWIVAEHCH
jgi:hypothetical protein